MTVQWTYIYLPNCEANNEIVDDNGNNKDKYDEEDADERLTGRLNI